MLPAPWLNPDVKWVCETHPDKPMSHKIFGLFECGGAGMMDKESQEKYEAEAKLLKSRQSDKELKWRRVEMGSNREQRDRLKGVHVLLALFREGTNQEHRCMRGVIRDYETDLKFLEMRCLARGGEWRIYQTVNMRDTEKAMKHLMKKLIDHPELCTDVDLEWRTSLLQPDCIYGEKKFMLDVDTKDVEPIIKLVGENLLEKIESPKGWHLITKPFDTREVCKMKDVSLQRDGYFYVKTVNP